MSPNVEKMNDCNYFSKSVLYLHFVIDTHV